MSFIYSYVEIKYSFLVGLVDETEYVTETSGSLHKYIKVIGDTFFVLN